MAHVQKRGPRKFLATYKGSDGKRHSKTFDRKLDADAWLAEQTVAVRSRTWVDPSAGAVTFGDYAHQWVRDAAIRPASRANYENAVRHLAELHTVQLVCLTPEAMRAWQRGLSERVAPSTAKVYRGIIGTILRTAVRDRRINASPLDGVPMPLDHDEPTLVHPMPVDVVRDLRGLIADRLGVAVLLGAGAGPRRSEALGLTVDRVDWLRRAIRIDRQLVGGTVATGPIFGPLKTPSSYRTLPVSDLLLQQLAAHIEQHGTGPAGLIFTSQAGGPVPHGRFTPVWRDALIKRWMRDTGRATTDAGHIRELDRVAYLAAHPDGSDWTFHDLRHFYASTLIADGQSVKVVQARLGHKTAKETLDTYGHLWPADEARTRSAVDRMLGQVLGVVSDEGDDDAAGGLVPVRR